MAPVLLFPFFLGVVVGLLVSVPPMIRRLGRRSSRQDITGDHDGITDAP